LTLTQNTYSNNSIPVVNEQFPLYTGKTWVETYTTTNKVTTFTSLNPTPTITTSNNYTAQLYSVTGSSVISVTAGSYLAYDIHSTNTTGTQDAYYSPQVENMVKGVSYYPNGTVQSTITLQDFNAWDYQLFFTFGLTTHTVTVVYAAILGTPWTTNLIYGGIAAAALALIVAAFLILRRRTKPPAVPTAPAEPYPPPTATPPPSPSP